MLVAITFATTALLHATPATSHHLLTHHQLQCNAEFPCPPELHRRVDFWIDVFRKWDKGKAILHDPNKPSRVYAVIDTGKGCSRKVSKQIKRKRANVAATLEHIATKIARKQKISGDNETHLAQLFPTKSPAEIRKAAKNIRCQSGVRNGFVAGLERFNQYYPMVDRILKENNLPADIRYLPFVESSYNPKAYSKVGAAGMWQIMPTTARVLGLELNATLDERLDPEAATRAAARYLIKANKSLSKVAKEIDPTITQGEINPFVITSYNYGVNGMRRAIKQIRPDFLEVLDNYKSPSFQVAVKNFYASFLAARHVATHADQLIGKTTSLSRKNYHTHVLQNPTSIGRIKKVFGVNEGTLKPLNPALTKYAWRNWRMVPAGYRLRLPARQGNWSQELGVLASLKPEKALPGGGK